MSVLTNSFLNLIKLDLKDFNFKNTNFQSKSNFAFEVNDKFKFKNFILKSNINLEQAEYKNQDFISNYFPDINEIILLKDHKLKLNYNKNKLSIKGEGKIKFEERFDKIEYLINKNKDNFNFTTDLFIENINFKNQKFLKSYFPFINNKINLKEHKLNIKYKNKNLLFYGIGKIKIDQKFDEINYFISKKENKFDFDFDLNLDKTNFKIDNLNYQKNEKENTQLIIKGNFDQNKNLNLINLSILENKNTIEINNLILGSDNLIKNIDKANFDYLDIENKQNKFSIQKIKKNIYELNGHIFNANTLITNILKGNDEKVAKVFENNISLNLNLDKVLC